MYMYVCECGKKLNALDNIIPATEYEHTCTCTCMYMYSTVWSY